MQNPNKLFVIIGFDKKGVTNAFKNALFDYVYQLINRPHETQSIVKSKKKIIHINLFIHRNFCFYLLYVYFFFYYYYCRFSRAKYGMLSKCIHTRVTLPLNVFTNRVGGFSLVTCVVGWCDSHLLSLPILFHKCIRTTFAPNFID